MKATKYAALLAGLLLATQSMADSGKGDPKIGKQLEGQHCSRCHDDSVYNKPGSKIKNSNALLARVRACNANTSAGLFPDEEAHIAAYLNLNYYHFKN